MAEDSFAPIPDRVRAPLDQPINAQSNLLTGDYLAPRHANHFNAWRDGASFNFRVGGPNNGSPCSAPYGSGELAQRRLAIPESHPRSFDEILAETSHTVIGCDAGFVEQRLGSLARTDRFQVSECIHDELHSAGLIHERLAAMVGQDDSDGVEQLRRRAGKLAVGPEDGAILEFGAADLRRDQKA